MRQFVQLVGDMRAAQKRYFKERTQSALYESKRLEKEVDEWLKYMQTQEAASTASESSSA